MKQMTIKKCVALCAVCLTVLLSGCLSIPTSPTPRFYALSPVDETQVSKKINITPGVIIGIGPVKIPEYQYRPQMVTQSPDKMLQFAQFDRWGESLDLGLARLIREDLTMMLPGAKLILYPWGSSLSVKYEVVEEVVQLDSDLDKGMVFTVQWMIIDVQNSKTLIIKRSEFHTAINPKSYLGLAKTLSIACASLSGQIAQELGILENKKR